MSHSCRRLSPPPCCCHGPVDHAPKLNRQGADVDERDSFEDRQDAGDELTTYTYWTSPYGRSRYLFDNGPTLGAPPTRHSTLGTALRLGVDKRARTPCV
ncbi:hypothetical protein BM1_01347 [Bipolaris maydis]|nr:hypothetical protein BM1_01347 [Bipolaris maydis]